MVKPKQKTGVQNCDRLGESPRKKKCRSLTKSIMIGLADISKIHAYAVKRLFNSTLDKLSPTESVVCK